VIQQFDIRELEEYWKPGRKLEPGLGVIGLLSIISTFVIDKGNVGDTKSELATARLEPRLHLAISSDFQRMIVGVGQLLSFFS
jgi:hypothetical protein